MATYTNILRLTIAFTLLSTVLCFSCYQCMYESTLQNNKLSSSQCAQEPFNPNDIKTISDQEKCNKVWIFKDGAIVGVHRGGGFTSVSQFISEVSGDPDSIEINYCHEDFCNDAPSLRISLGLITGSLILLRSFNS